MVNDLISDGIDMVIDPRFVEEFTPRHEQLTKWVTLRNLSSPATVITWRKQPDDTIIGRIFIKRYQGKQYKGRLIVMFRLTKGLMLIY